MCSRRSPRHGAPFPATSRRQSDSLRVGRAESRPSSSRIVPTPAMPRSTRPCSGTAWCRPPCWRERGKPKKPVPSSRQVSLTGVSSPCSCSLRRCSCPRRPCSSSALFSGIEYWAGVANGLPYMWTVLFAAGLALLTRLTRRDAGRGAAGAGTAARYRIAPVYCFAAGTVSSYLWLGDGHTFLAVTWIGVVVWFGYDSLNVAERARRALSCRGLERRRPELSGSSAPLPRRTAAPVPACPCRRTPSRTSCSRGRCASGSARRSARACR